MIDKARAWMVSSADPGRCQIVGGQNQRML